MSRQANRLKFIPHLQVSIIILGKLSELTCLVAASEDIRADGKPKYDQKSCIYLRKIPEGIPGTPSSEGHKL